MISESSGECSGSTCGYGALAGRIDCRPDDGSCWAAMMCEAEPSEFHDEELQKASAAIQRILNDVNNRKDGATLSFVHTEEGTLLAWVHHGESEFPEGAVTFKSGHEKVKKALKLKEKTPKE